MWSVEHFRGDARSFHGRTVPDDAGPSIWTFDIEAPAMVLGSGQPLDDVDRDQCSERGVDVVRRRSGGGAVLLLPGEITWVDVVLPASDRRWDADVVRSSWWLGEAWQSALAACGLDRTEVHRDRVIESVWSRRICFAGLGPGEVTSDSGVKIVGLSQRRTRTHARFQCAVHHEWRPELMAALMSPPRPATSDLLGCVRSVAVSREALIEAFTDAMGVGRRER